MRTTHSEQSREADPGSLPPSNGSPRTPRSPRTGAAVRLTAAVLVVLTAAACSSSKTSTSAPSTSASASASPSATGTAPADTAAATTQITTNWQKFFDPSTPIADKAALLQNGGQLTPVLQAFSADPRVGQVKATVTNVTFTSATTATVTYDLSLQGAVVQPGATGQAVLDGGTWKVSTATLCGLVKLSGNTAIPAIPGCS